MSKFYLVNLESLGLLKNLGIEGIYGTFYAIQEQNEKNGFNGINILDEVEVEQIFLIAISNFLIYIPNETPKELMSPKFKYGIDYWSISILKNSEKLYNIFDILYKMFEQFEDEFFILEYQMGEFFTYYLVDKEAYDFNTYEYKQSCEKIYKKDILYLFLKLKEFALKLKQDNFYIVYLKDLD